MDGPNVNPAWIGSGWGGREPTVATVRLPKKQSACHLGGPTILHAHRICWLFRWHTLCLAISRVWWLGFRLYQASGPRAAARERYFRVHGGIKTREASIARIGIAWSRQSSHSHATARIGNHEAYFVIRRRSNHQPQRHHGGYRRAEEGIQYRLDDLCRLDALALRRRQRHREEMGRQIRHYHQRQAEQRLRRIDQPVHRRKI